LKKVKVFKKISLEAICRLAFLFICFNVFIFETGGLTHEKYNDLVKKKLWEGTTREGEEEYWFHFNFWRCRGEW
jgi:hypothetical protein